MTYDVISAFIDRRTGQQIDPGEEVPEGLDRDTIARLVAARCLRPVEPETAVPAQGQATADVTTESPGLFSDAAETGVGEAPAGGTVPSARRPRRPATSTQ